MNPLKKLIYKVHQLNRMRVQKRRRRKDPHMQTHFGNIDEIRPPYSLVEPESIRLTAAAEPDVSIVIAAYGNTDLTLRCIASIIACNSKRRIEIIVIEDASGDIDANRIAKIPGLKYIENKKNMGYLLSCNKACKSAIGKYILLLNNDTELLPGAIDNLADLAESDSTIGIVGAKLVYPDGRLQEAGCIAWTDGTAWNYGRLQDPAAPLFNYVREVDYCSAACILIRTSLWNELDGFDEHYLPAYCEDLDLAFRARSAGQRVVYQPSAVVIHHEGLSHGTDTGSGIKKHQPVNQKKFARRWANVLEAENFESGHHVLKAKDRTKTRMTIVVIDDKLPEPDRDAGSRSMLDIIKALHACGYNVKFWPANQRYLKEYALPLEKLGIEVLQKSINMFFPLWIAEHGPDVSAFLVSRPEQAEAFLDHIRRHSKAKVLFYGHDLHFERMTRRQQLSESSTSDSEIAAMLKLEKKAWLDSDVVFYPSSEEAGRVKMIEPNVDARAITPYAVNTTRPITHPPATQRILFVAGFKHAPNVDAAVWLAKEIMPILTAHSTTVELVLAGSHPPEKVKNLKAINIRVTGELSQDELVEEYKLARLAVIPLRFGAGVKFKTIEAMAHGLPVVSTSTGVQGMNDLPALIQVADDSATFSEKIFRLLTDNTHWRSVSEAQFDYVTTRYTQSNIMSDLVNAIEKKYQETKT